MLLLAKFVLSVIATEAITEILTKSNLFEPFREFLFNKRQSKVCAWLHNLLDCGYCTSVWVGWFIAFVILFDVSLIHRYIDWFFIGLILHRLANVQHFLIDKLDPMKNSEDDLLGKGQNE